MIALPMRWQGKECFPWKVIACAVQGPSHREDETSCQDQFAFDIIDDRLIAVVSDGAGSAAASEIGAALTAEVLVEQIGLIALDPAKDPPEIWRPHLEAAIETLRTRLAQVARETGRNSDLKDFHATLVAVVATPNGGLFIHIGDGTAQAAGAQSGDNVGDCLAPMAASPPENGEEANTTFFVTLPFWRDVLRLTSFGPSLRIVLMTDGPMPFAATKGGLSLEAAFMAPVDAYLLANPVEDGAEALAETLNSPEASRISKDDKALLWATVTRGN